MGKGFVKLVNSTLDHLYLGRRAGLLDGDFTEEEADQLIADVAREKKEKYENMSRADMTLAMLEQLLEHVGTEDTEKMEEE